MATQVQLRGGTSEEHNDFIGVSKEVTVDTTLNTLRVHDGATPGGHQLALQNSFLDFAEGIETTLEEFQDNISNTHNHDTSYSKLNHHHHLVYPSRPSEDSTGLFTKLLNGYRGFIMEYGNETDYIRTTKNGILPYQSGAYSNIGTATWRFASGYFYSLTSVDVNVDGGSLKLNRGSDIVFGSGDDTLSFTDASNEYQLKADDDVNKSRLCLGHIEISGTRIYIGSSFPSGSRTNDILIQI